MILNFIFFLLFPTNGSVGLWETKNFMGMALETKFSTKSHQVVVVYLFFTFDEGWKSTSVVSWVPRHNSGHRKLSIRLTSSHDRELFEMKQTTICYEYGNGHEHGTQSWTSTSRRFSSFYRALHFHAFSRRFCWFCFSKRIFWNIFWELFTRCSLAHEAPSENRKKSREEIERKSAKRGLIGAER